jgi:hypothetical protein
VTSLDRLGQASRARPPDQWLRPRRRSRTEDAHRALSARDAAIADYTRDGVTRTVRVANTTPCRADILRIRLAHYQQELTELGVPVWDDHDETAVHLLCTEGGEAVGSVRVTLNRAGHGDFVEDFDHAGELIADEFLVFGRELVRPAWRGSEVTTAMVHAACLWWRAHSPVRRIAFTCVSRSRCASSVFGATAVLPPVPLGPGSVPVTVFTAELDTLYDNTARRLARTGWSASPRVPS